MIPQEWDWRTVLPSVVSPVKNQGSCGSCWAFAATSVLESAVALATGTLIELSPQQIASCTPNPQECGGSGGCGGATAQLAFNYTIGAGMTSLRLLSNHGLENWRHSGLKPRIGDTPAATPS
mmetsp:Transcript_147923/g.474955  ORF Transcript_147923/g.474955 Transcript_147923/m.474955 type:complete len:122 (+) Transcript_147923:471-836(+)